MTYHTCINFYKTPENSVLKATSEKGEYVSLSDFWKNHSPPPAINDGKQLKIITMPINMLS